MKSRTGEVTGNTACRSSNSGVLKVSLWHEDLVMGHELVQFTVTPKTSRAEVFDPTLMDHGSKQLKGQIPNLIELRLPGRMDRLHSPNSMSVKYQESSGKK